MQSCQKSKLQKWLSGRALAQTSFILVAWSDGLHPPWETTAASTKHYILFGGARPQSITAPI